MAAIFALETPTFRPLNIRLIVRDVCFAAANDNVSETAGKHPELTEEQAQDQLEDALRCFAKHGIKAAGVAREHSKHAFFEGDMKAYEHWRGVCKVLDRQVAATIDLGTPA
jgi:ribosomal protein S21